jgi:CheY-like chemotaxis protein
MEKLAAEIDGIREQLKPSRRPPKPKMLVVDDEPDNLDLLYRTFRRDFNVLKADSGAAALDILRNEGEVAVIISDQRMPEMKGTEFLSKTVPDFPDTVRIILTGFTDVEDLVDAINSGQVYKYITKPWDPDELKGVVQYAADSYDTLKQRNQELERAQAQNELMGAILQAAQATGDRAGLLPELAKAFALRFETDVCLLVPVADGALGAQVGGFQRDGGTPEPWLDRDPLTQQVLATGKIQARANLANDPDLAAAECYGAAGVKAHAVIPALFRDRVVALLSLQWHNPTEITESELTQMYLAAQQVGLILAA